jgi:hypothetical protein
MIGRPPPLSNGDVWLAHTLMPSSRLRLLEQGLTGLKDQSRIRDVSEFGDPCDTEIELWVHPDDSGRARTLLLQMLADQ